MVTIYNSRRQLHLLAHMKAKGISPNDMAGRLGIERESMYRQAREWRIVAKDREKLQKWIVGLGYEDEEPLWHLPTEPPKPSLDAQVEKLPEPVRELAREMAADIIKKFATSRR